MTESRPPQHSPFAGRVPPFTATVSVLAVLSTALFWWLPAYRHGPGGFDLSLYVSAEQIWDGRWLGLLTNVLPHAGILHLGFNLYWFVLFGRLLEGAIGRQTWVLLFVTAAVVSSAAELTLSGVTGVGLSGVLYAMLGYMWMVRRRYPQIQKLLSGELMRAFLVWLVICFFITWAGWIAIGNAAHVSGLIWGACLGYAQTRLGEARWVWATIIAAFCIVAGTTLWVPWSGPWNVYKATVAHERGDVETAERYYLRTLRLGADPKWVWYNIAMLHYNHGDAAGLAAALEHLAEHDPAGRREFIARFGDRPLGEDDAAPTDEPAADPPADADPAGDPG